MFLLRVSAAAASTNAFALFTTSAVVRVLAMSVSVSPALTSICTCSAVPVPS